MNGVEERSNQKECKSEANLRKFLRCLRHSFFLGTREQKDRFRVNENSRGHSVGYNLMTSAEKNG